MLERQEFIGETSRRGVPQLIGEMDGTNVPIVIIPEKSKKNPATRPAETAPGGMARGAVVSGAQAGVSHGPIPSDNGRGLERQASN